MKSRRISISRPVAPFSCITMLSALSIEQTAMIDRCNLDTVTVDPPSNAGYVVGETFASTVYTNTAITKTNSTVI